MLVRRQIAVLAATKSATGVFNSTESQIRGNRNYEQVNKMNGRPVRARTADLHRVKVAL